MSITNVELEECNLYPLLNRQGKCEQGKLIMSDLNAERGKWLEMLPSDFNDLGKINEALDEKCLDYSINFENKVRCNFSNVYLLHQNCKQLGIGRNTPSNLPCNETQVGKIFRECQEFIPNPEESMVLCSYEMIKQLKVSKNMQEIIDNQRRLLEKNKEYQERTEALIRQSMKQAEDLVDIQIKAAEERLQIVLDEVDKAIGLDSTLNLKQKIESSGSIDWKSIIIVTVFVGILIFIL
jgi:DNA mismatch repair ATPase MutS